MKCVESLFCPPEQLSEAPKMGGYLDFFEKYLMQEKNILLHIFTKYHSIHIMHMVNIYNSRPFPAVCKGSISALEESNSG